MGRGRRIARSMAASALVLASLGAWLAVPVPSGAASVGLPAGSSATATPVPAGAAPAAPPVPVTAAIPAGSPSVDGVARPVSASSADAPSVDGELRKARVVVRRVEIQPVVREDQALCPAGICAVGVDIALGIAPAGLLGQQPLAVAEAVAADLREEAIDVLRGVLLVFGEDLDEVLERLVLQLVELLPASVRQKFGR